MGVHHTVVADACQSGLQVCVPRSIQPLKKIKK
jgi:hypothetical protein